MLLNNRYVLAVTDDLKEVVVSHEVETGEGSSLGLEVVAQGLLDVAEHVDDPRECLLPALDIHGFDDIGLR